ncbi:MAG TPA: MFS transporter [Novosphingobium sp.]|nr:MFS transporter [Novosphingobium sp.]
MTVENPVHSFRTKFFYGIGSIAFGVKDNGFSVLLLLFYNQALGLDARLAGLAIAIALFVDAFIDPLIGYASDHLHTRWGRRHPFMYAAALPVALSYLLLFSPPAGLSQQALFAYLLVSAILVRAFIALYEIPSSALVAELTQGYDQRTSYLSWRYFFGWMGGLTMSVAAFGIFLSRSDGNVAGTLIPENYHGYGLTAAVIMLVAILASAIGTHSAIPWLSRPAVAEGHEKRGNPLRDVARALSSRSAFTILLAGMLYALASGMVYGMTPYFFSYFWELTPKEISILLSASYIAAVVALMLAPRLSRWFDKRRSAIGITFAVILVSPVALVLSLLDLFPANGSPHLLPLLFVTGAVSTTLLIIQGILFSAMLADVVEENEVRTGQREEGVFFAANIFVQKCVSGLGVLTTATLLSIADFPTHANPGAVAPETLTRLGESYVVVIVILNLASMACVWMFRITRASHASNLAILTQRRVQHATPPPAL